MNSLGFKSLHSRVVALLKLTGTYETLRKGHLLGVTFIDLSRKPPGHSSVLLEGNKKRQKKKRKAGRKFIYCLIFASEATNNPFFSQQFPI